MSHSTLEIDLPPMEGVGELPPLRLPATRYTQGGRTQYHINVPISLVGRLVQRPDPEKPLDGNRKVDRTRAKQFGTYVRMKKDWTSPAILVRTDGEGLDFQVKQEFADGTAWGILEIPYELLRQLLLLDGQHRSLGFILAEEEARDQIRKLKAALERLAHGASSEKESELRDNILKEQAILDRLRHEHVSIDIVEVSPEKAKQMFVDIANHAKGVNPDYTTVLDQRDPINRIAVDLMQSHRLLVDHVEYGQGGRMGTGNPNLVGAKAVADMTRAVLVGTGRVGARVGERITEDLSAQTRRVSAFFDTLTGAFPDLENIAAGRLDPEDLREKSLLGSSTMLRVLAAAYNILTNGSDDAPAKSRAEVETFFRSLNPHLGVPVKQSDNLWMSTGAFLPNSKAPQARQGSIKALTDALVSWARAGKLPLEAAA